MATVSVKALLKKANEYAMNKNYEETLRVCQEIFQVDSTNYTALVFVGASYEGTSNIPEAFKAFKKAIEIDSNQLLAWQGLGKLFDKADDQMIMSNEELFLQVLEKLRVHFKEDVDKKLLNEVRLCKLNLLMGKFESSLRVVAAVVPSKQEGFYDILFQRQEFEIPIPDDPDLIKLLMEASMNIFNRSNEKLDKMELAWNVHLKCLIKMETDTNDLWKVLNTKPFRKTSKFDREILFRIYFDRYPELTDTSKIIDCVDLEEDALKDTFLGLEHFVSKEYLEAGQKFAEALEKDKTLVSVHRFHAECLYMLHRFKESIANIRQGLKLLESSTFYGDVHGLNQKFNLMIVKNATRLDDACILQEALNIIEQLDSKTQDQGLDILTSKAYLSLKMNSQEELGKLKVEIEAKLEDPSLTDDDKMNVLLCLSMILLKDRSYKESQDCLERALKLKNDARGHFNLGLLLWQWLHDPEVEDDDDDDDDDGNAKRAKESREEKRCQILNCMKMSILMDAYNPLPYFYIGRLLNLMPLSPEKIKASFMKAFELDKNDNQLISTTLIDYLLAINDKENSEKYLNLILKSMESNCPKWALLRLGCYYMKCGRMEDAVIKYQAAVAKDVKDLSCWERLGDAYMERGSYLSALKAFTKVAQSDQRNVYSLYQIACVHQKLGSFNEAIENLEKVFEIERDYIPAHYRLGLICLELAKKHISSCLFGRALLSLQKSIDSLARACQLRNTFSCVWRTLGDALTTFYDVPDTEISDFKLPKSLKLNESDLQPASKLYLLKVGERCYSISLNLKPDEGRLWHDLGVNYHLQVRSQLGERASSFIGGALSLDSLARKAFRCLHRAVTLDPMDHGYWNELGVVAASKPLNKCGIAQHCFIKSIQLEDYNATAWTNLGFIYLIKKENLLANEAFTRAQSIEPLFMNSWIGQALIAEELAGGNNVDRFEPMDLFRHSVSNGNNSEAAISYAHWVCSTMDEFSRLSEGHRDRSDSNRMLEFSFKHLKATDAALDAMAKYTAARPTCIRGWNYFGLLCEKSGLHRTAAEAFERCSSLLNREDADYVSQKRVVLTNYSRLLCKIGDYESSCNYYNDLQDLLLGHFKNTISLPELCLVALSHFKSKNYQRSFELYQEAIECTGGERLQEDLVNLVLGICQFFLNDDGEAVHFILKGVRDDGGTVTEVLCSLLCLGLLLKQDELTGVVLAEMHRTGGSSVSCRSPKLAYLIAKAKLFLDRDNVLLDARSTLRDFLRAVHLNPVRSEGWTMAAMFLLTNFPDVDVAEVTKSLCLSALAKDDKTHHQEALQCLALTGIVELPCKETSEETRMRFKTTYQIAQKLVRLFPDQLTNWCILIAACKQQLILPMAENRRSEIMNFILMKAKWIFDQVEFLSARDRQNPYLKEMHLWVSQQYATALVSVGHNDAESFLEKVSWLYDDNSLLLNLRAYLDRNVDQLIENSEKDENASKILAAMIVSDRVESKKEIYKTAIEKTRWFNESQLLKDLVTSSLQDS